MSTSVQLAGPRFHEEIDTARRFTASALTPGPVQDVLDWLAGYRELEPWQVERIAFADLHGWSFASDTGNLGHHTGRFFTVEGLAVDTGHDWVPHWTQPIINQPEIGVLGILVKEFDGILHCLMQAKVEPGNCNGFQLSPTVQATRSNFTRAHGGAEVPYLRLFTEAGRARPLVDVLQSEQGSWFYRKRNRNMVVEVREDVPVLPMFRWLPLGVVLALLRYDNAVNMDARTVVSCIPFASPDPRLDENLADTALGWSLDQRSGSVHRMSDVVSALTSTKARHEVFVRGVRLNQVDGWQRTDDEIAHVQGKHFRLRAYSVTAASREVSNWTQPLLEPCADGIVAALMKDIGGIPHLLMHMRFEAGYVDIAEIAPTVQCILGNYDGVPAEERPLFLDYVSTADPARIRYDVVQSEEGGRFFRARNRYQVIEVGDDFPDTEPQGYRWMTVGQLTALLRHSYYVNIQARTIVAALHGLWLGTG